LAKLLFSYGMYAGIRRGSRDARFPSFRCRSSVAVSPFCRSKIPLFCKNSVRKFRFVTAVNIYATATATAKRQRNDGNRALRKSASGLAERCTISQFPATGNATQRNATCRNVYRIRCVALRNSVPYRTQRKHKREKVRNTSAPFGGGAMYQSMYTKHAVTTHNKKAVLSQGNRAMPQLFFPD